MTENNSPAKSNHTQPPGFRITTWNVNGIRNPFGYQPWRDQRTFPAMFDILEADIVVMQELKIQRKDLRDDMVLLPGWDCFFSLPKHKKGYSGVGIYTRQSTCAPIRAEEGVLGVLCPPDRSTPYRDLPENQSIGGYPLLSDITDFDVDPLALDSEGRCVVLEFPAFVLFGVYSPANSNGMRDDFRLAFLTALDSRLRKLTALGKRVILTGDLNVSRDERDTAGVEEDKRKMGMNHEQYVSTPNRRIFNQLIDGGIVIGERDEGRERPILSDLCREFHPEREGMYTHWEQKINARPGNYGSRIDYVLCSIEMREWARESNIQEGLMGSDHCPVYAIFNRDVFVRGNPVNLLDIVNPPSMFRDGERLREHSAKDLLPLSGKLLPEFDRRRSIKDMFSRQKKTTEASISLQHGHSGISKEPAGVETTAKLLSSQNPNHIPDKPEVSSIPPKRPAQSTYNASQSPSKKAKTGASKKTSKTISNGQSTLAAFLSRKKLDNVEPSQEEESITAQQERTPSANESSLQEDDPVASSAPDVADMMELTRFVDPIVSKESWDKLFTKKDPPRCQGHNEPCIRLETKKKGANFGRMFWICPRPLGPSGKEEKDTQWRCKTFIWASEAKRSS